MRRESRADFCTFHLKCKHRILSVRVFIGNYASTLHLWRKDFSQCGRNFPPPQPY
jgi:hypothetical protein